MRRVLPTGQRVETTATPLSTDQRGRALRDLRISVTDRCNFRCTYCMPRGEALATSPRRFPFGGLRERRSATPSCCATWTAPATCSPLFLAVWPKYRHHQSSPNERLDQR